MPSVDYKEDRVKRIMGAICIVCGKGIDNKNLHRLSMEEHNGKILSETVYFCNICGKKSWQQVLHFVNKLRYWI